MSKTIKVGSDFSGVGAFNQALIRLSIQHEEVFACDMDKYARETYIHNYGEPKYYPTNVYDREIPTESLDIYTTSPPCQAFSLAGKRLGKDDKRGVLFFNSLEFIEKNKPRYFIFENVKGLLSDDNGKTFSEWLNFLGGKSVNGNSVIFPYEDSVPYHLYWKVLNAKNYGVPQNRERVFLIGIRDDSDNIFSFPMEEHLTKRLKDMLENETDEKYFLSDKIQKQFIRTSENGSVIGTTKPVFRTIGERDNVHNPESYMSCLMATDYKQPKQIIVNSVIEPNQIKAESPKPNLNTTQTDGIIIHNIPETVKVRKHTVDVKALQECLKQHKNTTIKNISNLVGVPLTEAEHWFRTDTYFAIPNPDLWDKIKEVLSIQTTEFDASIKEFVEQDGVFEKSNRVYDENGIAPTMTSTNADERILTRPLNNQPTENLDADSQQGIIMIEHRGHLNKEPKVITTEIVPCLRAESHGHETKICVPVTIPDEQLHQNLGSDSQQGAWLDFTNPVVEYQLTGGKWDKNHEQSGRIYHKNGVAPTIHTMGGGNQHPKITNLNDSKESNGKQPYQKNRIYDADGLCPNLNAGQVTWGGNIVTLPNDYRIRRLTPRECFRLMDFPDTFTWICSDSQAYKQAGNSIVVGVLAKLIQRLKLNQK